MMAPRRTTWRAMDWPGAAEAAGRRTGSSSFTDRASRPRIAAAQTADRKFKPVATQGIGNSRSGAVMSQSNG